MRALAIFTSAIATSRRALIALFARGASVGCLRRTERQGRLQRARIPAAALSALLVPLALSACDGDAAAARVPTFSGNSVRGADLIGQYGCGSCHQIPGIDNADGVVGPPLTKMGARIYIAGLLRNTPDNMMLWLQRPQQVVPGNAMPNMGISQREARDITAYLYTLR